MKNWKKNVGRILGRGLLRALVVALRVIPLPKALAFGRLLGGVMRRFSKKRYAVALKNLRIAYGDTLSEQERQRIAEECFRQFGMFAMEIIKFAYLSSDEVAQRIHVSQETVALLEEARNEGHGCLLISAHLGNFEVGSRWLTDRGYEVYALARESRDKGTTRLMTEMRERNGVHIITMAHSLKPLISALRRNAFVAIICDQNAADQFVPFFGRLTGTVDGPARFALKTGAPLIFYSCVRDGRDGYLAQIHGIYHAEKTEDQQADIVRVTTEINLQLETMIRSCPEQWLWFHDRWKSSPKLESE